MIPLSGAATKGGKSAVLRVLVDRCRRRHRRQTGVLHRPRRTADLHRQRPGHRRQLAAGGPLRDVAAARHERPYRDRRRPADCHRRRHPADQWRDHQDRAPNWSWPPSPATSNRCGARKCSTSASIPGRCANGTNTAGCSSRCLAALPASTAVWSSISATGAWARFTGWDAMCFIRMRGDMFFGTQDGRIMQADRTGYDDGMPYVATLVGGWEMFSVAVADHHLAAGAGLVHGAGRRAVPAATVGHHRLRRHLAAAAAGRARILVCSICGIKGCGTRRCGTPARRQSRWCAIPVWVSIGRHRLFACADRAGHGGAAGQAGSGSDLDRGDVRARRRQRIGSADHDLMSCCPPGGLALPAWDNIGAAALLQAQNANYFANQAAVRDIGQQAINNDFCYPAGGFGAQTAHYAGLGCRLWHAPPAGFGTDPPQASSRRASAGSARHRQQSFWRLDPHSADCRSGGASAATALRPVLKARPSEWLSGGPTCRTSPRHIIRSSIPVRIRRARSPFTG